MMLPLICIHLIIMIGCNMMKWRKFSNLQLSQHMPTFKIVKTRNYLIYQKASNQNGKGVRDQNE